jgi:hypothetical protein
MLTFKDEILSTVIIRENLWILYFTVHSLVTSTVTLTVKSTCEEMNWHET